MSNTNIVTPMVLENYGLRLVRLAEDKIELIRHWRNHPKIREHMYYKEYISSAQQQVWFKKINNEHNYYFIIEVDGIDIGLVDIKDIDYNIGVGESGIFIWDDRFYGKLMSYRSLLLLHDFAFEHLHLTSLISHILIDNVRSRKCYSNLGFQLDMGQANTSLQRYVLTADEHRTIRKHIEDRIASIR